MVCLQETKLTDEAFTELLGEELDDPRLRGRGARRGGWNGVAILSRVGLDDVVAGIPGGPGFPDPEARAVSATCDGIRVHLGVRAERARARLGALPSTSSSGWPRSRRWWPPRPGGAIVCGDINIAPTDADVFDPEA